MHSDEEIILVNNLHSHKLRSRFGEIDIDIIKQDGLVRVSLLKDKSNEVRTIAITVFSDTQYSSELNNINTKVRSGGLIGESIIEHGFDVVKKVVCKFQIQYPELSLFSYGTLTHGQLSEVFVRKENGGDEFYAEVCEIYSPDFNMEHENKINFVNDMPLEERLKKIVEHACLKDITLTLIS